jgi:TonB family protein
VIGIAGFLSRQLARVEPRHWAGIAASAALHLAVILGWHAAPPPEPQPISFEVSFEPPTATPLPAVKAVAKPQKKVAKIKKPKQKVAHQAKPKKRLQDNPPREAHLLDATWKAERKAAKDVPALVLPDATVLGIQADSQQLAQAGAKSQLKSAEATRADAVVPVMATSGGKESSKDSPSGAQLVEPETTSAAAQTPAPANEPADGRLALASTTTLSAAQNSGSVAGSGGAQVNNAGLSLAGGDRVPDIKPTSLGQAAPTQTALAQAGAGMQTAAAAAVDAATVALASPAGTEAPGVRLHTSQALSGQAALPAASGSMPMSSQAASMPQGAGQTAAERPAQLASIGGKSGQALRSGGQTPSASRNTAAQTSSGDAGASRGGRGQETSGRLAAVDSAPAAGSGPVVVKGGASGQAGSSGQHPGSIRLAPGEPGSSPGFAVTLQPVVANAPGGKSVRGSGNAGSAVAGAGRASYADAGRSRSAVPGAVGGGQAGRSLLASPTLVAPAAGRVVGGSGGFGGTGVAAAPGQAASIALLNAAREAGRPPVVLQATQPVAVKVVRPDTEIQPLDVLAPSNYCPLPLPGHAQPDNRAPRPNRNIAEQPAYALDNPSINYPVMANIRGVEGRVTVRVEVLTSGRPGKMWLKQSSGSGILDQDAQTQLKHWRFVPARKNGQPVTAWIDIPVLYRLSQARP